LKQITLKSGSSEVEEFDEQGFDRPGGRGKSDLATEREGQMIPSRRRLSKSDLQLPRTSFFEKAAYSDASDATTPSLGSTQTSFQKSV
jgi:hypothetical protein